MKSDLDGRITRLEAIEAIRRQTVRFFQLCDVNPPYDAVGMSNLMTEDAYHHNGEREFYGRQEFQDLLRDLAQESSVHRFTNQVINLDASCKLGSGFCYAWEANVIGGRSIYGGFTHNHVYRKVKGKWLFADWRQIVYFHSPFESGWVKGPRVVEQFRSRGA